MLEALIDVESTSHTFFGAKIEKTCQVLGFLKFDPRRLKESAVGLRVQLQLVKMTQVVGDSRGIGVSFLRHCSWKTI